MDFRFSQDIKTIREILGLNQDELALQLGVQRVTISRSELGKTKPSPDLIERVYSFAFEKNIKINRLKEMIYLDNTEKRHKLLYHGSKSEIDGDISAYAGKTTNDFGQGFYAGESYVQAASFVASYEKSSLYLIDFDSKGLKPKNYLVDRDWMLTIAYYRGTLNKYEDHPMVNKLIRASRDCDYIIAPIADNRMFMIIDSFISGEITDEQCKHCLAATNLGSQYVFINDKSVKKLRILEKCYISNKEKEFYKRIRTDESKLGEDKVKLARIKYRGKGKYIDEILT